MASSGNAEPSQRALSGGLARAGLRYVLIPRDNRGRPDKFRVHESGGGEHWSSFVRLHQGIHTYTHTYIAAAPAPDAATPQRKQVCMDGPHHGLYDAYGIGWMTPLQANARHDED